MYSTQLNFLRRATKLFEVPHTPVLVIGLDGAGQASLCRAWGGAGVPEVPAGLHVEHLEKPGLALHILGHRMLANGHWRKVMKWPTFHAVVFVVDASNQERVEENAAFMRRFLAEEALRSAAWLVVGNKRELPGALGHAELQSMGLRSPPRPWALMLASASTGDGCAAALQMLTRLLARQQQSATTGSPSPRAGGGGIMVQCACTVSGDSTEQLPRRCWVCGEPRQAADDATEGAPAKCARCVAEAAAEVRLVEEYKRWLQRPPKRSEEPNPRAQAPYYWS